MSERRFVHRLRELIHYRYLRAVVAGLAAAALLCSLGAVWLAARHDVSSRAVTRFFLREHLQQPDLTDRVMAPETLERLRRLYALDLGTLPGGMVYADEAGLSFHLHRVRDAIVARARYLEDQQLYPRLVRHYLAADLESLLADMQRPPASDRLRNGGLDPAMLFDLEGRSISELSSSERNRLLRRAARYIPRFAPFESEPFQLSLAEKLRFYERPPPRGRFVGSFEIQTAGFSGRSIGSPFGSPVGRDHHLVITRFGPERFLIEHQHRGEVRRYTLTGRSYAVG